MAIYHVKRITETQYDEYSDFVVRADSEARAMEIVKDIVYTSFDYGEDRVEWEWTGGDFTDATITRITNGGVEGVICSSFHAG